MLKKHPLFFGSLILIVLSLFLVLLINLTKDGSTSWGEHQIGIIEIKGIILDPLPFIDQIKKMELLDHVKGVLVRIESPGGSVAASQEIHEALLKLKKKKIVYASLGSLGASGGYYIACAADRIIANPGTLTGSIGVLLEWVNLEGLSEQVGIEMVSIKSGKYKNVPSMFGDLKLPEREILKNVVQDTHEQFVQVVINGRPQINEVRIRELADGRVFTGQQAFEVGLVDALGGFSAVIENLSIQLGIPVSNEVLRLEKERSTFERILGLESVQNWLPRPIGGLNINYLLK